ncbi:tumor necrosis factor receptor superfamily member 14-like isoform X2 [Dromiciops gliroides]|nr:tumor necrosis factor receptor superfamily member 14-like isoform X2 [Dromiciops gliroides]
MMFSMIMITQLIPCTEALECRTGEYELDGQCCPTCPPGYRVDEICHTMRGTMCVPCDPRTYTAHPSVLKKCLPCKVCDLEFGLVTRRECSSTSNTVCSCSPGYFCADVKNDHCEMCVAHRVCSPGQYIKSRGTERNNTICEKCPAGTFSLNGTLHQCLPWTNCSAQGLSEENPGTYTTDAVCSSHSPHTYITTVISVISTIIVIIIAVMLCYFIKKKKPSAYKVARRAKAFEPGEICHPLEADGSVTNIPVQETRQQVESAPQKERMPKSQDSREP